MPMRTDMTTIAIKRTVPKIAFSRLTLLSYSLISSIWGGIIPYV